MPLSTGDRLGPYEILAPVGAGGMGEVYRARDSRIGREVAVKVLHARVVTHPDRLRRFEQEMKLTGALNHPNILTIYDTGSHDGAPYIVSEILEGETLRERLTSGGALGQRRAIEYAIAIAQGLAAAHEKGIVHRDLKPENIFLIKDGRLKILDFGLAKLTLGEHDRESVDPTLTMQTEAGAVMGTPGYMAPEQVSGRPASHRADIFCFGCILYEMLTGQRAFRRDTMPETLTAILKEEPAELPHSVPPLLDRILRRCLEKKPEERFESARDLAFALETVSTMSGRQEPLVSRPSSRHWVSRAAVAAFAVALPLSGWFLARRTERGNAPRFHQVTFRRGLITAARFADGGKTIVYSAGWDGKPPELFSTQESSPESRPLGMVNARVAAISRGGEMALILGLRDNFWLLPVSGTLARAPVSGGAAREVAEKVVFADWSPDGSKLAVVRDVGGGQVLEYPLGQKVYQTAGAIYMPRVSPKGDLVAFVDSSVADFSGRIVVVDASGGKRMVSAPWGSFYGLNWSPGGSEVWATATNQGTSTTLVAVDMNGKVRVLASFPGFFVLMDVAPDGRLLLMQDGFVASLYMHRPGVPEETDLYWHDNSIVRALSPDGNKILFSEGGASTTTDWVTYIRSVNGSPAVRLGEGMAMSFSPDGKWTMTNPNGQLMAYPTRAGDARQLTSGAFVHSSGAWLHDGGRIVFVGNEPGHLVRFYVQDSPAGAPRAISGENIEFDRYNDKILESPDGRNIAAVIVGKGIELLPIDAGAAQSIPGTEGFQPIAWCRDGDLLMYRKGEVPVKVLRVDPRSGKQRPWKEIAPRDRTALGVLGPIRFASDCETYAYTAQYDPSTLTVLTGVH